MNKMKGSDLLQRARTKVTPVLGLCAWTLVGSTNLQADEPMEAAGVSPMAPVKVFYDGVCPRYVDDQLPSLETGKGGKITWTAYDVNKPNEVKEDAYFEVYFDPFTGGHVAKAQKGVAQSQPLDGKLVKNLLFKYTIVGTDKSGEPLPACSPVDPFFRIR